MKSLIYALSDPRVPGLFRYIGATMKSINERFIGHLRAARSGQKLKVSLWLSSLLEDGVRPQVTILAQCDFAKTEKAEAAWIKKYSQTRCLLNAPQKSTYPKPKYCHFDFGQILREWRGARSVRQISGLLGIPYGTWRKYEEGTRYPSGLNRDGVVRRIRNHTPNKLALAELERRLMENTNERHPEDTATE